MFSGHSSIHQGSDAMGTKSMEQKLKPVPSYGAGYGLEKLHMIKPP